MIAPLLTSIRCAATRRSFSLNASIFAGVLLLLSAPSAADNQQQLDEVEAQLAQRQSQAASQKQNIEQLQQDLKKQEVAIANSSSQLRQTNNLLSQLGQRQSELEQQQQQLQAQLSEQQQRLAEQIQGAYQQGHSDYLKMLLNQQQGSDLERMLSYYHYLSKARAEAMQALRESQLQLAELSDELERNREELVSQQQQQKQQQQQLAKQQDQRKQRLAKLREALSGEEAQIEQLQIAQQHLKNIITQEIEAQQRELERSTAPLDGLAKSKGKLPWPLTGRVLHSYNSPNRGQTRWQGMVIDSHPGTAVKAVAEGNVVFADWLRGYGLVIVLDHGDEYLSLYGYNQSLTREVGERVKPGDTIAHAGNTGGQPTNSLFFQLRHHGNTLNPNQWLARR